MLITDHNVRETLAIVDHAVQNGNTLNGPALEVRLKEQAVETKGRSTLVISGGR